MAEATLSLSPFLGLDLYSYPNLMKDGYSPDCFNVEPKAGIMRSCNGYGRIKDIGGCERFFNHYKSDGTMVRLVFREGNIESFEDGTTLKENYFAKGNSLSMVNYQLNDTYITVICNGKDVPVKYDGSGVSNLGGGPPVASLVELHNERLFMAGNPNNPDRVYYSASFNPESWNAEMESGYIDLPSWDGGRIKEIKSLFGDLVVFKDYGLYRIYGTYPGEFGVEKISSNVGCINREAVAFNGEICYFLNHQGLCAYNGMSARLLDNKRLKAIFDMVDFSRIDEARLYNYSGKLYMLLPMAREDWIIEYDYEEGTIVRKKGFGVKQFFSDKEGMYIVDGDGFVCQYDVGADFDGNAIECRWKSRDYDLGAKGEMKNVLSLDMSAKGSGSIKVRVTTDRENFEKEFPLTESYSYYRLPIRARGRMFTVELENVNGSSFELDSPILFMDIEEE